MGWTAAILALFLFQAAGNPVRDGLKALDEKRYEAAAQAFQQAIEADPKNYGAHFNLAFAYSMMDRPADAIASYKKALEYKPGLYQAELNLGILLLDQHRAPEALPYLRDAAKQKPSEFRTNYYLGQALYATGDDAGAERAYTKAAAIDPKAPDVEVALGRAIFNQGRFDEAIPHYRQAAELDPRYRQYLIELGSRFEEKGRAKEAIELYQQFPEKPAVQERLGNLLLQAGRVEEALPHLQRAVAQSPTTANRYALATAYIKLKQPAKALPLLDLALAELPDNFELLMVRGRLRRDQRQFLPAAQDFLRAIQQRPKSAEAWRELAGMLIMLEDYPKALAALDKVEALGNPPPSLYYFRAIILDKTKQYKPALASYEKFLQLSKDAFPNEEFKARQRIKAIHRELRR